MIAYPFPEPTALVQQALAHLRLAAVDPAADDPSALPRPWDPASCPAALRREVWYWLDDVASWINTDHSWQPDRTIPACWPAHPHIAHELAVVACQRLFAGRAFSAERLEEWHRYTLPMFLDRMANQLRTGCTPGKHREWPAAARHRDYTAAEVIDCRRRAFAADAELITSTTQDDR